jgi:ferric-dicitrate binding protein FerR (iron transport regulator)
MDTEAISTITREAADWLARIRAGCLANTDAVGLAAWLERDPRHQREFNELLALWDALSGIDGCADVGAQTMASTIAGSTETTAPNEVGSSCT